jgi:hypothetical protein
MSTCQLRPGDGGSKLANCPEVFGKTVTDEDAT